MSQQINLLQRTRKPIGSALAAIALLFVLLLVLLGYDSVLRQQTTELRQQVLASERQLQQAKAALAALGARNSVNTAPASVKTELDALKSRLALARQWGELINSGSLGSPNGYAKHLNTLASVPEPGLWLTSVLISDGGKLVNLGGRALQSEAVLRYAEKLNQAFGTQGVQFNSVEMTPEDLVRSGEAGKPLLSSVNFRLF
jgi:hypothetical protein